MLLGAHQLSLEEEVEVDARKHATKDFREQS